MYKLCKSEQTAMRQRQLEKGLLQAMLTQRYEDISISDLCQQLNIPRKSFYRYFSSKDGALFALLDHTLLEFDMTPANVNTQKGSAIGDLQRYFVFWHRQKDLLDALMRSSLSGLLVERSTSMAVKERMMPEYMKEMAPDRQGIALSFAVCGLISMVLQWHHRGYPESPAEMAQIATSLLTQPLIRL